MKKITLVSLLFLVLAGCSRDTDNDVRVSFVIPGTKKSEAEFLPRLVFPATRALPSTGTGFDCIGLNIIGPGIPSRLGKAVPSNLTNLINSGSQCTYPGSSSLLVKPGASDTEVTAFVPAGDLRLLQVVGLQKTSDTNCTFPISFSDLWVKKYLEATNANIADFVNAYEIGRKIVSLPLGTREARFDITDSFNQVATKPLHGDTDPAKNCPSLTPNDTMTCQAVMTVNRDSTTTITKNIIPYIQGGTAPYTFANSFTGATLVTTGSSNGDLSYLNKQSATTFTGVTVTDANGKTAACSVDLKTISPNQIWFVADDSSYNSGTLSYVNRIGGGTATVTEPNLNVIASSNSDRIAPLVRFNLPTASPSIGFSTIPTANNLVLLAVIKFNSYSQAQVAININRGSSNLSLEYNEAGGQKNFVASTSFEQFSLSGADNEWHLHQLSFSGSASQTLRYAVSGISSVINTTLTNSETFTASAPSVNLGQSASLTKKLNGGIAEVVVMESPTALTISSTVGYLKAKYGL